ncbi:pseudouridine synthase [Priestia taiwanensis]|uniref:Pseudouridine synthase n=1 Tax=Priestia taiwanensis TaxID=1347902 RepID=A0A917ESN5_9BACI|nr:pseudouridine synthase [Priestia taiwanensis]MBM7364894.1 23S rRNA pseudouridine2604 synthase [Priestia taiwanensis]GGE82829.1 pseudouridine synthase [Priestia taiwanensis]
MRIDKFISETGYCSRRETKRLLDAKRITINGYPCDKNSVVEEGDCVLIDGRTIPEKEKAIYIVLNKPIGITCTAANHIEGNIIDFVNYPARIFPIGRLDKASEGLILLTNDGDIVNRMMRSQYGHEKEYVVTVDKPFSDYFLEGMSQGVNIVGGRTKPCTTTRMSDNSFRIILTQGLNRQIRRMCRYFGYTVTKLERVRIMNIELGDLPKGEWRYLTQGEQKELMQQLYIELV